jgi:hypothetical protein
MTDGIRLPHLAKVRNAIPLTSNSKEEVRGFAQPITPKAA